jgi:antitoxin VapB
MRSNVRSFIASLAVSVDETSGVWNGPRKIMAININHPETERLAREVAKKAGETLTDAIRNALQERLQRLAGRSAAPANRDKLHEILSRVDALPRLDSRTENQILGYDESGIQN